MLFSILGDHTILLGNDDFQSEQERDLSAGAQLEKLSNFCVRLDLVANYPMTIPKNGSENWRTG